MTKAKNQVFLDEVAQDILNRLCKRFGWTSGQAIERLIRYYASTQKLVVQMDIDDYDEAWGGERDLLDPETGEYTYSPCVVWTDPENVQESQVISYDEELVKLVEAVKEGLTPMDGFGLEKEV